MGSYEYLVYSNVFVGVAGQFGLVPIIDYKMPELTRLLDPVRRNKECIVYASAYLH